MSSNSQNAKGGQFALGVKAIDGDQFRPRNRAPHPGRDRSHIRALAAAGERLPDMKAEFSRGDHLVVEGCNRLDPAMAQALRIQGRNTDRILNHPIVRPKAKPSLSIPRFNAAHRAQCDIPGGMRASIFEQLGGHTASPFKPRPVPEKI